MLGRVISVNDWAQIRYLSRSEKLPGQVIAQRLGVSRNAVAKALASDAPPDSRSVLRCRHRLVVVLSGQFDQPIRNLRTSHEVCDEAVYRYS